MVLAVPENNDDDDDDDDVGDGVEYDDDEDDDDDDDNIDMTFFRQATVVLAVIRLPRTWLVMVRRAPGTKGMMLFIILMDFMMRIIIRMMIIVKILTPLLVMVRRCEESHEQKV